METRDRKMKSQWKGKHVLLKIFDGIAEAVWFGPCSY